MKKPSLFFCAALLSAAAFADIPRELNGYDFDPAQPDAKPYNGDFGKLPAGAEEFDARLHELYHFLGIEPNPIPVKALLALNGIGHGLRLPLQPLSSAHAAEAQRLHADTIQLEQRSRIRAA